MLFAIFEILKSQSKSPFKKMQKNDLILHLQGMVGVPIEVVPGHKTVEVRPQGINKGERDKERSQPMCRLLTWIDRLCGQEDSEPRPDS